MSATILDLPPEILEHIFRFLRPNLEELLALSHVCSQFYSATSFVSVPIHIPLTDGQLKWMAYRAIPVDTLCNREPTMFVKYQVLRLIFAKRL